MKRSGVKKSQLVVAFTLAVGCGGDLRQAMSASGSDGSEATGGMSTADGSPTTTTAMTTGESHGDTAAAVTSASATGTEDDGPGSATTDPGGESTAAIATGGSSVGTSDSGAATSTGTAITCAELVLEDTKPPVCSQNSGQSAKLVIQNDCESVTVETWWVGYGPDCTEEYTVAVTPPGGIGIVDPTYATHPFRIRNQATGELMVEIPPLAAGETIVVVP